MPAFEFDLERPDDRYLILLFLHQLQQLLSQLVLEPRSISPTLEFVPGSQASLRDIWSEMPPHFDRTVMAVRDTSINRLTSAGLTGTQLRGKLLVLQHWAKRLVATPLVSILFKLLANVNSILGSLVQATGAGEVIKEFKELLENAIDDLGED